MLCGAVDEQAHSRAVIKCASHVQRVALLVLPAWREPEARAAGASSRFLRALDDMTETPRAKRRARMAAGDDEDPPHRKHRTDQEEREAHSEAGARGRKVNGVKALRASFSYEQVPYWLNARVYLIHRMQKVERSRDGKSRGESISAIRLCVRDP